MDRDVGGQSACEVGDRPHRTTRLPDGLAYHHGAPDGRKIDVATPPTLFKL